MMRRILLVLFLCLLLAAPAVSAQTTENGGITAECPGGRTITNGVEVIVNMRPGFTYTATAVGVGEFDPVMAVADRTGVVLCADDSSEATGYEANLPSTGSVGASARSAQMPFSHSYDGFEDISIIVGDFNGGTGEFVLILEGMVVTNADGDGDPFTLKLTENIVRSDVNMTAYMMAVDTSLDPLVRLIDSESETLLECNDAGNDSLCAQGSADLASSFLSRSNNRETPRGTSNAMLVVPTTGLTDLDFSVDLFLNFLMTSFGSTGGEYAVGFHIGIGDVGGSSGDGGKLDGESGTDDSSGDSKDSGNEADGDGGKLDEPGDSGGQGAGIPGGGVTAECPGGGEITNGVEILVNMRPGFTYTATAIGVDGFDPVIAVADRTGVVACMDDAEEAGGYSANLPTTGSLNADNLDAQIPFSHSYDGFEDISLIVGGFGGSTGEFLLVIEGLAVTSADGDGDPFATRLTPNIINADIDMSVYMLAVDTSLDPYVRLIDSERETVLECDDAGNDSICAPGSSDLSRSFVTRSNGQETPLAANNAMLYIATTGLTELDFSQELFFNFLMTSFGDTGGEYLIAFHIGIGEEVQGQPAKSG